MGEEWGESRASGVSSFGPKNPKTIISSPSTTTSSVPSSMQHVARVSRQHHAKILGRAYRQPQFNHLKSAMSTQATSEGHSPVITPASLKTKLKEKLEALYVDVEDISGKSSYTISTFSVIVYVCGVVDLSLRSRRLRIILPGKDSLPTLRQKDQSGAPPPCKCCLSDRDCGYPCLDAKMLYARGVGETNTSRSPCCRE